MINISAKKKHENSQNVQNATPKAQEESVKPDIVSVEKQEATEKQEAPKVHVVSIREIAKGLSDDKVAMCDSLGIPIKQILGWAVAIEDNARATTQAISQLGVDLKPLIDRIKEAQATGAPATANPTSQPQPALAGGIQGLLPLLNQILPSLGFGGAGTNPLMEKFFNSAIDAAMSNMAESQAFDKVFRNYMINKMSKEIGMPLVGES